MRSIAIATPQERGGVFAAVTEKRPLPPALIEKDFWVCWILQRLFALPDIAPHLLFKGGTTLSKVYDVIHRFSEDIDVSVARDFVSPGNANAVDDAVSKTQQKKAGDRLKADFV